MHEKESKPNQKNSKEVLHNKTLILCKEKRKDINHYSQQEQESEKHIMHSIKVKEQHMTKQCYQINRINLGDEIDVYLGEGKV